MVVEKHEKRPLIRYVKWIPLVVLILVLVAGGSVWAHQVIAERLAQSSYSGAASTLSSDIQSARRDGLFPSELQPYSQELAMIQSQSAPGDKVFWSGTKESYYDSQSKKLRSLDRELRTQVVQATAAARGLVKGLIDRYAREMRRGGADGMGLKTVRRQLTAMRLNERRSSTVGQYRGLVGVFQPQLASLEAQIKTRRSDLARIIAGARASSQPLAAVRAVTQSRLSDAQAELGLLHNFAKAEKLGRWLTRASHWALSRSHVRTSAIGAVDVGQVDSAIRARLAKVAPAKWILVSTEGEWMEWFQGADMVGSTLVTTGNPQLPTPHGHFSIIAKFSPFTFVSPEPPSSPWWYEPSPVSYAMEFQVAGYYIHDAPWRTAYGPGTDGAGQPGTNYGGSHGCVNTPFAAMQVLYGWTPMGTPVIVV